MRSETQSRCWHRATLRRSSYTAKIELRSTTSFTNPATTGTITRSDFKRGRAVVYRAIAWTVDHETPIFTQQREYLKQYIPVQWQEDAAMV